MGHHTSHQEVSRCHTRGESQEWHAGKKAYKQVHPGFETQGTHHQKSKTGVSVGFFTISLSDRKADQMIFQNLSFERSPIQHKTAWPKWLGVRLQRCDGCCWEIKSHWRQLFGKFIFPEFFCLADILSDFLSDLLIVKNPSGPTKRTCVRQN